MPQKTRKLVVAGPLDSGKTSWCKVFHRIIPPEYIASVTNEGQFSAAMITDLTQLTIIDEWSSSKMRSDLAKTILQGGWMVTSIKHALPKCVNNNCPFYISTNNVPDLERKMTTRSVEFACSTRLLYQIQSQASTAGYTTMQCIASSGLPKKSTSIVI